MTQWCQLKRQCHKFPQTLTYFFFLFKLDSRRRASSGDFWHICVIKKWRTTFDLFWCYSRVVCVSAALRLMIAVACHVFMSACQVIPVLRLSQFFLREKKALSELPRNSGGLGLQPLGWLECVEPGASLLDNIASLCALGGKLPNNNFANLPSLLWLRYLLFPVFVWSALPSDAHVFFSRRCVYMGKRLFDDSKTVCSVFMVIL